MSRAIAVAIVCLAFLSQSYAAMGIGSPEITPLCAIIKNSSKFEDKAIVVTGLYKFWIHGAVLMDRSCPDIIVNLRNGSGYRADRQASATVRSLTKKDSSQPIDVVLRGILHVAHKEQSFGEIGAPYEIEITELLTARPVPPESSPTSPPMGTLSHEADHTQGTRAP